MGRRHRLAAALAVGAGRARRRPGRLAAGDHLLEPAGQGLGAAAGRARRGLSRGHPGAGAVRARPPHLARAACRRPRPDRPTRSSPTSSPRCRFHEPTRRPRPRWSISTRSPRSSCWCCGGCRRRHRAITAAAPTAPASTSSGLRDWQAGDRFSAIDWPQSSLTNFAPLVVREFDRRAPPRCWRGRRVAVDPLRRRRHAAGGRRRPRRGHHRPLGHVLPGPLRAADLRTRLRRRRRRGPAHRPRPRRPLPGSLRVAPRARAGGRRRRRQCGGGRQPADDRPGAGHLRLPVRRCPRRRRASWHWSTSPTTCSSCSSTAPGRLPMPPIACGWITVHDVEGGEPRVMSRRAYLDLPTQAADWQDRVARSRPRRRARRRGARADERQGELALAEFVAERRLRRVRR